jgi:hypothetical protein
MRKDKGKGQIVHTSISMRLGVREHLDLLGETIKENTGIDASRSKLITVLTNLAYEARDNIDYSEIHDETTLQRELVGAIIKKFGREQAQQSKQE